MSNKFYIGFELTRHCNLRCQHCFRADLDKEKSLPFELIENILDQAGSYGQPHIAMTGGEPTLHPRFVEILELVIAKKFTFHFVTNGFNCRQTFKNINHLFGNPFWTSVSISLDGASSEIHDAIRGKGSFAQALTAIAISRSHHLETVAQMVINKRNRHELEKMALLCAKMEVNRLQFSHMQPSLNGLRNNLMLSATELKDLEKEISHLQQAFTMPIVMTAGFFDPSPLTHCRILQHGSIHIDFDGNLVSCCQLSNYSQDCQKLDIIADLRTCSLYEAHKKLLEVHHDYLNWRLKNLHHGVHWLDHFHCWTCLKYFEKLNWMKEYKNNEWVQSDPYFESLEKESSEL